MRFTRVLFRSQAREKILNGVNTLADAHTGQAWSPAR